MNLSLVLSFFLLAATSASTPSPVTPSPEAGPPSDPRQGGRVLHFGDSFVTSGFSQAIKPKLDALGVRYTTLARASTTTWMWASDKSLASALAKKPDLVLITLGANEIFVPEPSARAKAVRSIVKKIGSRPCVWIAPPPWKGQNGILDVIRENAAPCLFFDSEAEVEGPIERRKDGIHPSMEGGKRWADAFWAWLEAHRDEASGAWALRARPSEETTR